MVQATSPYLNRPLRSFQEVVAGYIPVDQPASKPLSRALNAAILTMANKLFPTGFDVGEDAPQTLEDLTAHIERTGRMLVWAGASEQTIYADAEVNWAFRAWHDWHHWKGQYPFTLEGEAAALRGQCRDLKTIYGDTPTTRDWCRILHAEIIGQFEYNALHQRFPEDQYTFVVTYISDPGRALALRL